MTLPELSAEERASAAAAALAARRRRAAVKDQLANGTMSLAEVLDLAQDDPALAKMRVVDLLSSLPRIGPVRAMEIMARNSVAPSRRIRGLGERQRTALLAELGRK